MQYDTMLASHLCVHHVHLLLQQHICYFRNVLKILIRKAIREELGATYSPYVGTSLTEIPDANYQVVHYINTNPDEVEDVITTILDVAQELREEEISTENLDTAKEQYFRTYEEALEKNGFWLSQLQYYYTLYPNLNAGDILTAENTLKEITTSDIQAMAQRYLNDERYVQIVLYPEALEPSE